MMKKVLITGGTTFVSKYAAQYNYEYYLDVQKQQKLFPQTILLEDGLREAAEWYLANEEEVMKKPYIQYIDENFA